MNYKKKVLLDLLKDFNMPSSMLESLSDEQIKQFYILFQKVMIRVAVHQFREDK